MDAERGRHPSGRAAFPKEVCRHSVQKGLRQTEQLTMRLLVILVIETVSRW
jgi:hypothetical protein